MRKLTISVTVGSKNASTNCLRLSLKLNQPFNKSRTAVDAFITESGDNIVTDNAIIDKNNMVRLTLA